MIVNCQILISDILWNFVKFLELSNALAALVQEQTDIAYLAFLNFIQKLYRIF